MKILQTLTPIFVDLVADAERQLHSLGPQSCVDLNAALADRFLSPNTRKR